METGLFSQSLIKGLTDKIYDRRKGAALEIERLTFSFISWHFIVVIKLYNINP
jgi:hypothetical protein